MRLINPFANISTGITFTEKSITNEQHNFVLNLSQTLDLKSSNKLVALQKLSIYYT